MRISGVIRLFGLLTIVSVVRPDALLQDSVIKEIGSSVQIQCPQKDYVKVQRRKGGSSQVLSTKDSMIGNITLRNVTVEDSGIYTCLNADGTITKEICLTVGEKPKKPTNISCVTDPFLENMRCCWNVSDTIRTRTTHFLHYVPHVSRRPISQNYTTMEPDKCEFHVNSTGCVEESWQCCQIKSGYNRLSSPAEDGYIWFDIHAESKYVLRNNSTSISPTMKYYPSSLVKPPPPRNVGVSETKEGRNYSVTVKWEKPEMANILLSYELRYRVDGGSWKIRQFIHSNTTKLEIAAAFHDLQVQVSSKPSIRSSFSGFYSDWSDIAHLSLPNGTLALSVYVNPARKALIPTIIGLGLIFAITTLVLVYRKRKNLKSYLVRASVSRLPHPTIIITLGDDGNISFSEDQLAVIEHTEMEEKNAHVMRFRGESFTNIEELLPLNQGEDCGEIPDYAVGMVQASTSNKYGSTVSKDNDIDQRVIVSSPLPTSPDQQRPVSSTTNDGDSIPHYSGPEESARPLIPNNSDDDSESYPSCSYSTVPGYLSCTTPLVIEGRSSSISSIETITDYATFDLAI